MGRVFHVVTAWAPSYIGAMKFTDSFRGSILCLLLAIAVGTSCTRTGTGEPTAFQLIKKGKRYVAEGVKDKVVQIRSDESVGNLTPSVWYVVYYDPDATFKAVEVKFGAGEKLSVTRPMRVLEYLKADKVFDRSKLKIDSDKAIKIATREPLLAKLKLTATQLWLEAGDGGPEWRVRIWAAKLKDPATDVDIGEVHLSAQDGSVTKSDLRIDRVD